MLLRIHCPREIHEVVAVRQELREAQGILPDALVQSDDQNRLSSALRHAHESLVVHAVEDGSVGVPRATPSVSRGDVAEILECTIWNCHLLELAAREEGDLFAIGGPEGLIAMLRSGQALEAVGVEGP